METGDDIPDQPATPPTDAAPSADGKESSTEEPENGGDDIVEPDMTDVPVETLGAILIAGDTAYEYYNFSQTAADTYVAAMNRTAAALKGKATVYDMIVPTSMDITLPASVRKNVQSADQR